MEYKYIEVLKKYRDANKTSSPKDEFNKLFAQFSDGKGIKNMGGFRIRKSAATGSVAFVILITVFVILIKNNFESGYLLPFYIRRFIIHPLFLLILLPAFYYQKLSNR